MLAAALAAPVGAAGRVSPWDVVVAGGGPAGAMAAHQIARRGFSVLVLERATFPRWKVCGACLSPGSLAALERAGLGDLPGRLGGVPLERMTLQARYGRAALRLGGSVALSRAALDGAFLEAARARGAVVRTGARASLAQATDDSMHVEVGDAGGCTLERARVLIDATGLGRGLAGPEGRSGVRPGEPEPGSRIGVGAQLDAAAFPLEDGELRMVVGGAGYVGLVRVEGGAICVAAAVDPEAVRVSSPAAVVNEILAEAGAPPLAGTPTEGWRGTPPLTRRGSPVGASTGTSAGTGGGVSAAPRLLRAGDAAGYVEPFTGEGIYWALAGAERLARLVSEALEDGRPERLAAWQEEHARAVQSRQLLCRALARGLRRPPLVGAALRVLARAPVLAAPFVRRAARAPRRAHAGRA